MSVMDKKLRVTMPDGSKWDVPVSVIANDRAKFYADEQGGSVELSLKKDTIPLFEENEYEIEDWASNNMNWSEVETRAVMFSGPSMSDYRGGWVNGDKEIVD